MSEDFFDKFDNGVAELQGKSIIPAPDLYVQVECPIKGASAKMYCEGTTLEVQFWGEPTLPPFGPMLEAVQAFTREAGDLGGEFTEISDVRRKSNATRPEQSYFLKLGGFAMQADESVARYVLNGIAARM